MEIKYRTQFATAQVGLTELREGIRLVDTVYTATTCTYITTSKLLGKFLHAPFNDAYF